MENIVDLAEYRKRREPERPARPPKLGAQYFCTSCDGEEFRLSPLGSVHCAGCGALMRNLVVSPSPSQEAG